MAYPPVIIVDEQDQEVGLAPLDEASAKGLYHRLVRIVIEDEQGRLLLQKRAAHMRTFPNCWDSAAAGHVDQGDTYDSAAQQELAEEVGLHLPLTRVGRYFSKSDLGSIKEYAFSAVYRYRGPVTALQLQLEAHEVSEARWFTVAEIKKLLAERPAECTDGLREIIARYY